MPVGGPWFESAWTRLAYLQEAEKRPRAAEQKDQRDGNAPGRVIWDLGVLLLVPLMSAAFVGLILSFLQIK